MGLDWNPIGKPLPGHEAEFDRLLHLLRDGKVEEPWSAKLRRAVFGFDREAATERWFAIQDSPFLTVHAPQVGRDPAADEWARARYREQAPADRSEAQFLDALGGYHVVELAPPCDGIPWYSNGAAGYIERYSFRAQFIVAECGDVIAPALLEQCYESCAAPGLAALGAALRACAADHAAKHDVAVVESRRELEAAEGSPELKAHILFSAARWCEWWSSRGHGMEAYF